MSDYSDDLIDEAIVYAEVLADWFGWPDAPGDEPNSYFSREAVRLVGRAGIELYKTLAYDEIDGSRGKLVYLEVANRLREGWRPQ